VLKLQQSRISKFSGGGLPDPLLQGEGREIREGRRGRGRGNGREGGRGRIGTEGTGEEWKGQGCMVGRGARHGFRPPPQRQALDPPLYLDL